MHFKERGRKAAGEREAERQMQQNITVLRGSFFLFALEKLVGCCERQRKRERDGDRQKEMAGETQRLATKVSGQKEFFYLDFCGNVPSLFTPSLRLTLLCSSTECVELGFCNHTDTHSTYTETPKWSSKRDDK